MEMEHFSHNHPLSPEEVQQLKKKYEDRKLICYGCHESILSENFAYCCTQYNCEGIFFHKSCAELPLEILHPKHQQHSLILHQAPLYQTGSCECDVCDKCDLKGFTYNCSLCEYDVDIECVSKDNALMSTIMDQYLDHKSHKHRLIFKQRPARFFCNACGTVDEDQSYSCTTASCPFWIHRSCALLPESKESKHHNHPLSLAYSFPSDCRHHELNCDYCRKKLYLDYWVYQCRKCRYFLHVKCVDTEVRGFDKEDKAEDHCENCSIKLPGSDIFVLSNIFVGLTRDFLEKFGLAQQLPEEPKHFSHMHSLIFSIGHQRDVKEMKYEEALICDGCILPICDSYYSCLKCNYFLHESCAQLPEEFEHPSHPEHPLVLRKLRKQFSYKKCSFCGLNCNGFLYSCAVCKFHLDLKCAMLSTVNVIMHEAHPHKLENYSQAEKDIMCSGCKCWCSDQGFGCKDCEFYLHYKCILLPRDIRHAGSFRAYKWDIHPLTLMYPPFSKHPEEFYCEICEEEIHPKYWLYHCSKCDRSFHIYCLVELTDYRNMKFGTTFQVLNHSHAVKFIIRGGFTPFCDCCDGDLYCQMAFECKDCEFYLCYLCAINSHDFSPDMFKSSMDNTKKIVAEDSNSGFEDEAIAHYSVNLPTSDLSFELTRNFLKRYGFTEPQFAAEITHFCHNHPLHLSTSHGEDVKVLKNDETLICDGCIRPISDSYYCCNECNFFLHEYCAQLPYEIQHPFHSEHSLFLSKPLVYQRCSFCRKRCNGFLYKCKEICSGFSLDVHCTMLHDSSFIMHEAHCHQLHVLTHDVRTKFACIACRGNISYPSKALGCEDCSFHIHHQCAILPRFARHAQDKHPLLLICHSFSQHPKVIDCGFCKEKIYTIYWFYYCSECNQSFHPHCVCEVDNFRNLKLGGILQVRNHPHPLKFVRKGAFHCDLCGIIFRSSDSMAYGCEPCGYYNCIRCVERSISRNKLVEGATEEDST